MKPKHPIKDKSPFHILLIDMTLFVMLGSRVSPSVLAPKFLSPFRKKGKEQEFIAQIGGSSDRGESTIMKTEIITKWLASIHLVLSVTAGFGGKGCMPSRFIVGVGIAPQRGHGANQPNHDQIGVVKTTI
jgi:hypothetical protein